MARRSDKDSDPQTLAGLWLKQKPARARESTQPTATPRSTESAAPQLDLLFASPTPAQRRIWSVAGLVSLIRGQLERDHTDVWVEGEISNLRPAPSGHLYFTLKDGDAQLPVVLFRNRAQLLKVRGENLDGLAVLVRGRISVYEPRGQLQLIAETLEPRGAGALQLAFDQLKARLLAEGLFDSARKRPLPAFPRTVGVITSTAGAVLHDIVKITRRRHARLNLLVYPATVQGPGCVPSVIAGIDWFNSHPNRADLILIARGGGALEDLAGFNDEALARAIAASTLPVVSAIGHETDFTIADFVADLRAPTPSAAAELITAAQHQIEDRIAALDARVRRAARYQLILARQRLTAVSLPAIQARIESLLGRRAQRLDDLRYRLDRASSRRLRTRATQLETLLAKLGRHYPASRLALTRRRLERASDSLTRLAHFALTERTARLNHATVRLAALSPLAVLERGYALVYLLEKNGRSDGTLLRDASTTNTGDQIRARLARGTVTAAVTRTED